MTTHANLRVAVAADAVDVPDARELAEEIDGLHRRLAEGSARERLLELELSAARRDREVAAAHNESLTHRVAELRREVDWLKEQLERSAALLTEQHALIAEAEQAKDCAVRELLAERSRLSYEATGALLDLVSSHRRAFGIVARAARSLRSSAGRSAAGRLPASS